MTPLYQDIKYLALWFKTNSIYSEVEKDVPLKLSEIVKCLKEYPNIPGEISTDSTRELFEGLLPLVNNFNTLTKEEQDIEYRKLRETISIQLGGMAAWTRLEY